MFWFSISTLQHSFFQVAFTFCLLITFFSRCSNHNRIEKFKPEIVIDTFTIVNTTIRALKTVNDSQVWFAGSNGKWGYTLDGGKNWTIDSIIYEGIKPDFRSIDITENGNIYLVSVAEPAAIFMANTSTLNWQIVYIDTSDNAFFDMVVMKDNQHGILLGDPQLGCFHIATTIDNGVTWQKIECDNIPISLANEAPFAASNSNMLYLNQKVWFATGGIDGSRIYHSSNSGKNWKVANTPIVAGKAMTGIYSLDFYNDQLGIIAGGNWDSILEPTNNIAVSQNGGLSWQLKNHKLPYISCAKFIPGSNGKVALLLSARARPSTSKLFYYDIEKDTCISFNNPGFLSLTFASSQIAWLGGKNKIGRLTISYSK